MSPRTVALALLVLILLLCLPFVRTVYWIGSFPLTVDIDADPEIDTSSLHFATCWTDGGAEYAAQVAETGLPCELDFQPADLDENGAYTCSITCHGSDGPFGIEYAYTQPKFLVIQYQLRSDESPRFSECPIPTGPGPQHMHVSLP